MGRAGDLLNDLLEEIGLPRDEVYITNVVKCRPPNNRDPRRNEIKSCNPYLKRQLEVIKPKVIATLGNHATKSLIGKNGITKLHGKEFDWNEKKLIPLYHPAAGLYNPNLKKKMIKDMKKLTKFLPEGKTLK